MKEKNTRKNTMTYMNQRSMGWVIAVAIALAAPVGAVAAEETAAKTDNTSTSKTGSGERYITTITLENRR
jgi:hypothetical protein